MRPEVVQSIDYLLFQWDEKRRRKRPVFGHIARRLDVCEVVFPELVTDERWDVDCSGYNFCHELVVADSELPGGRGDVPFELVYRMTDASGEVSIISFQVRMFPHDGY